MQMEGEERWNASGKVVDALKSGRGWTWLQRPDGCMIRKDSIVTAAQIVLYDNYD